MSGRFAVILVAAGKSTRFAVNPLKKTTPKKPFADLCGKAVWEHSAALFAAHPSVRQILVVLSAEDRSFFEKRYAGQIAAWSLDLVDGGQERFESVENGLERIRSWFGDVVSIKERPTGTEKLQTNSKFTLKRIRDDIDFVAIHDAARPCVTKEQVDAVFSTAQRYGAAILASPVVGTLKRVDTTHAIDTTSGLHDIVETVPRHDLWEAQTPQVFRREWIVEAYHKRGTFHATDDAQLLENIGRGVKIVPSERTNLKITTPFDLAVARQILTTSQ
ncbi:MAG: 2-C-methyl-D-erythritol 4-phosphate cytidylyltransferase [Planctomycetaceae bacterium]|nr:2-C-methyl-D-erythritol 4-phosphate cytidylyltransferase [Planctomycetaceae bacterium]